MLVKELHIVNLRNHTSSLVEFGEGVNVISGSNGSGKTSILEAVSVVSISKTFLPSTDTALIKSGQQEYKVSVLAESNVEVPYRASVEFRTGTRKRINSSVGDNLNPKDIIGTIPLVILSPDFKSLTFGSPQDKRQFLDMVLSQSGRQYADESIKYKKYLKQRNAMLSQHLKSGEFNRDYFEILTGMYIRSAVEIFYKRINFIKEFRDIFIDSYKFVSKEKEMPGIVYNPDTLINYDLFTKDDISKILNERYHHLQNAEMRRGASLFGPHRDDLFFTVNGLNSKDSASQGQHKSLLISIKLAEFEFLKNILNETPILLFDDIFSELDSERSAAVFTKITENNAQTIITLTNAERFINDFKLNATFIEVENGKISERNAD